MPSQPATAYFEALVALDLKHDELLRQLEQLDQRIERVLQDNQPSRTAGPASTAPAAPAAPARPASADLPAPSLSGGGPDAPTC